MLVAPAQGILAQLRILGGSLGIAASTLFVQTQSSKHLVGILPSHEIADVEGIEGDLSTEQLRAVHKAYSKAFQLGMATAAGVSGAAVLVALFAYQRTRSTMREKREILVREEKARREAQVTCSVEERDTA